MATKFCSTTLQWCARQEEVERPKRMIFEAQKYIVSARRAVGLSVDDIRRFLTSLRQERLWKDQARAEHVRERERTRKEAREKEEAAVRLRDGEREQERERRAAVEEEEDKQWERERQEEEEREKGRCEEWVRDREKMLARLAQIEQEIEVGRSEVRTLGERLGEMRDRGEIVQQRVQEAMSASGAERARRQGAAHELGIEKLKREEAASSMSERLAEKRGQVAALKEELCEGEAEARELRISLEHITRAQQVRSRMKVSMKTRANGC
jgi:chromosome segregation ATPase